MPSIMFLLSISASYDPPIVSQLFSTREKAEARKAELMGYDLDSQYPLKYYDGLITELKVDPEM
jgi:hypothetical protein